MQDPDLLADLQAATTSLQNVVPISDHTGQVLQDYFGLTISQVGTPCASSLCKSGDRHCVSGSRIQDYFQISWGNPSYQAALHLCVLG